MPDKMKELLARRPTRPFDITLNSTVIEEFWELGFTSVTRITTDEEIRWLGEVYDLFFSGEMNLPKGALVKDMNVPLARQRGMFLSQVLFPEFLYPQLRETISYQNTRRIAQQLLGGGNLVCWGHMMRKAPNSLDEVAWHQDEAYWDPHFERDAAAFWMPLEDAKEENGAMRFIPGSHKGPLFKHGFADDDPSVTALMLKEEVALNHAVLHPVPAGGTSIHHQRVIHGSGPNLTDRPRRAYVNVWNSKVVQRLVPHERPWYWEKKKARDGFNNETQYYHDDSFPDVTRPRKVTKA